MYPYLGDFSAGATVRLMWNSFEQDTGASVTRSTDGSIRVYKGSSTTERSSSAGITDTEDFDSVTGVHHLEIDLSDDTDTGFYEAGYDYFVVLVGASIDGQTVNRVLGQFSIENRDISVASIASALFETTMPEGYASDGSNATLAEMLYMIWAALAQFSVSGTTITARKLDGSTTAMTFSTDDASNPTQRIRAS